MLVTMLRPSIHNHVYANDFVIFQDTVTISIGILYCESMRVLMCLVYVTRFAKTCIVHTSTFSTLKIHKICCDY